APLRVRASTGRWRVPRACSRRQRRHRQYRRCARISDVAYFHSQKRFFVYRDSTRRNQACHARTARAKKKPRRSGAFPTGWTGLLGLKLVGGRLARHEVVEGVLGHPEPQDLFVAEGLPGLVDLLELGVLGDGFG